jgi:hypothetical protein
MIQILWDVNAVLTGKGNRKSHNKMYLLVTDFVLFRGVGGGGETVSPGWMNWKAGWMMIDMISTKYTAILSIKNPARFFVRLNPGPLGDKQAENRHRHGAGFR